MQLLYLAKVVETRSYAEEMLDGCLRVNRLSYFIKERKQRKTTPEVIHMKAQS